MFSPGVSIADALKQVEGAVGAAGGVLVKEAPLDALLFVGNLGDMADDCE